MVNKASIAILSTVINFELYTKSSKLFPLDVQKYIIDGRSGMHGIDSLVYMMRKLKNKNIEWLIMADEDVLFLNSELLYPLIEELKSNNYMYCGIRDGGEISHRTYNPYAVNTFFSIINFKELEGIWNKREMLTNQYILDNEFNDDLGLLAYPFDRKSLFEPYYCFYFWLRRQNKKCLFLDSKTTFKEESISNTVFDLKGAILLYHTWQARFYGVNEKHTERINNVFNLLKYENKTDSQPIIFKDRTYLFKSKVKKMVKRITMKISLIFRFQYNSFI